MRKFIWLTLLGAGLASSPAFAEPMSVGDLRKAIEAAADDPAKVTVYCAMAKKSAEIGDDVSMAEEARDEIDGYFKKLGADFETAWTQGQAAADGTPEATAFDESIRKLDDKCELPAD